MPTVTQSRVIPFRKLSGKTVFGGSVVETFNSQTLTGIQTTTSYRSKKGAGYQPSDEEEYGRSSGEEIRRGVISENRNKFDNGHNFSTELKSADIGLPNFVSYKFRPLVNAGICTYSGFIQPVITANWYPAIVLPSDSQITKDGTAAIANTIPTAPEAGLAQFVGELKDGLPKLTGVIALKKGPSSKSIGEEYLNREFGQKPFINDLTKFANALLNANKIVAQYQRDSGRNVRRRRSLGSSSRKVIVSSGGAGIMYPRLYMNTYSMVGNGVVTVVDEFYDSAWFSGAYTYYATELNQMFGKLSEYEAKANHLLGTRITPETVWELTPWSWLIDWYSNIGQIVHNASLLSQDSTVLRYGYVMHETHATRSFTVTGLKGNFTNEPLPAVTVSYSIVAKRRTRATPYGFGIDVSSLSPRRWAILAALGMTKGSKSLRLTD